MIVLDENLHDPLLIGAIAAWYPGQVVSLTTLRPDSLIKDEAVPTLLLRATQPTFLTINVNDFWKKSAPHRSYCLVLVDLPAARVQETAIFLRRLLQFPRFRTKAVCKRLYVLRLVKLNIMGLIGRFISSPGS
jgi:hypothetical protein